MPIKFYMNHPCWCSKVQYPEIFTITTNSLVNSYIYMVTSFDPKLGWLAWWWPRVRARTSRHIK